MLKEESESLRSVVFTGLLVGPVSAPNNLWPYRKQYKYVKMETWINIFGGNGDRVLDICMLVHVCIMVVDNE